MHSEVVVFNTRSVLIVTAIDSYFPAAKQLVVVQHKHWQFDNAETNMLKASNGLGLEKVWQFDRLHCKH